MPNRVILGARALCSGVGAHGYKFLIKEHLEYRIFVIKRINMPEISRFYGIIIYMFFSEHNPPHFHVKYQEYEATVEITDGVVHGIMPRRALTLIFEWLDLHKEELLENWKLMFERKPINKIDPLK